ncbi:hypothetical protein QZH41_007730 [Actinostola sp. cb2023]|nr:hypothetical protein QZH41_007730 [Actinostola sp. cb2023]
MQASVSGISTFFEGLAKFDQGIASDDAASLKEDLDRYTTTLATVETKLKNDINEAMTMMQVILAGNLVEETAKLVALVTTNSNPLKLIFGGADVSDVMDQSGKVADAAAELAHGIALFVALDDLTKDSLQLKRAFGSNAAQISTLQSVVDKIRNGQGNDIGEDSDKFIEEYSAYTPQTDRSILAKNDALWSAFKDATCDVLNGEVGVAGSIPKGIAGGKLLCERLEGTLAQFFTLREDIFDFQNQLVDSVAAVVRGNLAQRFARNIEGKHDVIEASQLMTGFFMMQSKIQKVISVYCDVMEYKNLGKRVQPCSTINGLFVKENIDALISYNDNAAYDEMERVVYIPTRAQSDGDTGVVDLQALGRGETVIFQIPVDKNWLTEYGWILPGQRSIPFIKSLKLFLPRKTYEDSSTQGYTTTQVIKSMRNPAKDSDWKFSAAYQKPELYDVSPAVLDEFATYVDRLHSPKIMVSLDDDTALTKEMRAELDALRKSFGGKGKFDPAQRLKPGQVPGIDCGKFGCCDDYSKADFTGQVGCAMKLCVDNFIETCNDIYRMPRHQKEAECSNSFTRKNCPYTCNACTCQDRYARVCQMFKDVSRGCESNSWRLRNFMGKYCPRTCGRCPEV